MNKLFDAFTWKLNETGLAEKRSKEHISKYGNGLATMHDPTIKAILHYATISKSYGCAAVGTSDSNVIVEVNENDNTKLVIFSETTKRFMASNYKNGLQTPYKLAKNADDGSSHLLLRHVVGQLRRVCHRGRPKLDTRGTPGRGHPCVGF